MAPTLRLTAFLSAALLSVEQLARFIPSLVSLRVIKDTQQQNGRRRQLKQVNPRIPFPDQCSREQLDVLQQQLPADACNRECRHPWSQLCSFSFATKCRESVWLDEYYQHAAKQKQDLQTVVFVGCNKAMDAVNTLRMLTGDARYDKTTWRDTLFADRPYVPGVCSWSDDSQFQLPPNSTTPVASLQNAAAQYLARKRVQVHCIEAMPMTAANLEQSAQKLGWNDQLLVQNTAMGIADGTILFPDVDHPKVRGKIGAENAGTGDCSDKHREHCKSVPLYRLDTYAQEFIFSRVPNLYNNNDDDYDAKGRHQYSHTQAYQRQQELQEQAIIDFLNVDAEGLDWDILLGGQNKTLDRVAYLEFEYNWVGGWKAHTLQEAIDTLRQEHGFVCYWPGRDGLIWRITDCWQEHYHRKFWSNVACVNYNLASGSLTTTGKIRHSHLAEYLAQRMEELFHETLRKSDEVRFDDVSSIQTNGRRHEVVAAASA